MKKNILKKLSISLICLTFITGCGASTRHGDPDMITSINIIDRNGMSETISSKDRLEYFNKIDFLSAQPYQKVLRVYGRDKNGDSHSCITSYHPNGELKQSLKAVNNRAYGPYLEYYSNGEKKIESFVIGGIADINTQSEQSWLFDGISRAWNDEGELLAEISYKKGELEGESLYYHSNGNLWKKVVHKANQIEGFVEIFLSDGSLLQRLHYKNGKKEGESLRFWQDRSIAYKEVYEQGELKEAAYFSQEGALVSEIREGNGFRAIFSKDCLEELHEYKRGVQEGVVKVFNEQGQITRLFSIKEGEKHGEEYDYYVTSDAKTLRPKLMISWRYGTVQGVVQSWYFNGSLESRKEISQNQKNGLATGWYENGGVMYVEEYDRDALIKGEYYRINEKEPVSIIKNGDGMAMLFDTEGSFIQKVLYHDGHPVL